MKGNSESRAALIETAMKMHAANDSRPVFERLRDFAQRGTDAPDTLTLPEIRQLAFAMSIFLELNEDH